MSRKSVATTTLNQDVTFGSAAYFANQSAFTVIIWFKTPSNAGGSAFAAMVENSEVFPGTFTIQMNTSGAVVLFYRGSAATTFNSSASGNGFDDGQWHWVMVVRRSATDHQWYIDGTSIATSATDPGAYTPTNCVLLSTGTNNLPAGGQVDGLMVWRRALTVLEGRRAAYLGMDKSGGPMGIVWCRLGMPTLEIDLTGNKNNGTPGSASTIGESVPPRADYWDIPKYRRPQIKAAAIAAMGAQFVNLGAFNRFGPRVG